MDSIYFSSFAEPTLYRFQAQLRLYFKLSGSFILSDTMEQVEEARYRSARAAMVVRLPIFLIKFPWFDFWEGSFSFSFSFSWINSPENRCRVVPCMYIYIYIHISIFLRSNGRFYTRFRSSVLLYKRISFEISLVPSQFASLCSSSFTKIFEQIFFFKASVHERNTKLRVNRTMKNSFEFI